MATKVRTLSPLAWAVFMTIALVAGCLLVIAGPVVWDSLGKSAGYRYAIENSDSVVAAGCEMMDRYSGTEDIPANDPRVSEVLRNLRACSISVSDECVYIYIGGHAGEGYFIYREPDPDAPIGSDCHKITDRLWYYEGA